MSAMTQTDAAVREEEVIEPDLEICDPHHHLMDHPGYIYYRDDFLADTTGGHRVTSSIFIEASSFYRKDGPEHLRSVGEVAYIRDVQQQTRNGPTAIAKGIVSYVDLTEGALAAEALDAQMEASGGTLKGVRHDASWTDSPVLHTRYAKTPPNLYASPEFRAGVAELTKRGLSLDAWQYFNQLPGLIDLVRAMPDTRVMLDHVGGLVRIGPYEGKDDEVFATWRGYIRELAQFPNVWVKLGGLGMHISGFPFDQRPTPSSSEEIAAAWKPFIETCIEAFGSARAMFESNFPVDRPSCSYRTLWNALKRIAAGASDEEKALLFRESANRFYKLA
jgi:predicted TIM-barrel fold metal-dependent hydrolase